MAEDIGGQIYPSYTANVNPQVVAELPTPARPTGPLPTSLPTSVYSRPTMSEDSLNINLNTTDIAQLKRAAGIIAVLKSIGIKPNVASDAFRKIIPQSLQGFLDMGPNPEQLTNLIAQARTGGTLDPQAMRELPFKDQMSIGGMWQTAQQAKAQEQVRQQREQLTNRREWLNERDAILDKAIKADQAQLKIIQSRKGKMGVIGGPSPIETMLEQRIATGQAARNKIVQHLQNLTEEDESKTEEGDPLLSRLQGIMK